MLTHIIRDKSNINDPNSLNVQSFGSYWNKNNLIYFNKICIIIIKCIDITKQYVCISEYIILKYNIYY